jgi:hypothetical protein
MHRSTSPSNIGQEHARQASQAVQRPAQKSVRRLRGKIAGVHPSVGQIKVLLDSGKLAKGGGWVPIINSPDDIALRFGTLEAGQIVILSFTSDLEKDATAEVVGVANNIIGNSTHITNEVGTGLYEIFTPGIV